MPEPSETRTQSRGIDRERRRHAAVISSIRATLTGSRPSSRSNGDGTLDTKEHKHMGMELAPFAQHGLTGLAVGGALIVIAYIVNRGVKLRFEAEIPPKGINSKRRAGR